MIRFITVQGSVVVDDKRNGYTQMAVSGLELDETIGNYLIATTTTSSAQIFAGGKIISVGQQSFLRIGRDGRTWLDRHYDTLAHGTKLFIGRLWARIANDPRDPGEGNSAVGVRG